ncbi:hypothetical protein [Microlunatus antarcticus]
MKSSRPSGRRLLGVVVGLLLVAVCGACSATTVASPAATPSTTTTSPEPPEPSGTLYTDVDEQLSNLITEIEQDRDGNDIPGYAGVAVDPEHRALDLWWVGTPPARVAQLIVMPPHDLAIRLHRAGYDYATTDRALDELMDRYPVIHSGSPEDDGSGIEVETTAKGKRKLPSAAQLSEQAEMPVRIVVSEPPEPA